MVPCRGTFVSSADMEPCLDRRVVPDVSPRRPYRYALEVPQGDLDKLGIGPGSRVEVDGGCGSAGVDVVPLCHAEPVDDTLGASRARTTVFIITVLGATVFDIRALSARLGGHDTLPRHAPGPRPTSGQSGGRRPGACARMRSWSSSTPAWRRLLSGAGRPLYRSRQLPRSDVGRVDRWGKRRLAYELQHHRDGYYVLVEATAEPAAMAELDRALHLADEVLRHKVIRIPDKVAARPAALGDPHRRGRQRPRHGRAPAVEPPQGPERSTQSGIPAPERPPQSGIPVPWKHRPRCRRAAGTRAPHLRPGPRLRRGGGRRQQRQRERSVRDGQRKQRHPGRQHHPRPRAAVHPERQAMATFGLAVNRRWQNRQTNEWEEATSFFDVVCWREMAENVERVPAKGARVIVTGRLEQRSLGDPGGRQALEGRGRRRRDRPEPAVGHRRGAARTSAGARATAAAGGRGGRRRRRRRPTPPGGGGTRLRLRRGALLMARGNERRPRPASAQGLRPPRQEAGLHLLQGAHRVGRLQGRQPAPPLHVRPGQDPGPPGLGQLRPAPARGGRRHQDRARAGPAALHAAGHGGAQPGRGRATVRRRPIGAAAAGGGAAGPRPPPTPRLLRRTEVVATGDESGRGRGGAPRSRRRQPRPWRRGRRRRRPQASDEP